MPTKLDMDSQDCVWIAAKPHLRHGLGHPDEDSNVSQAKDANQIDAGTALHLQSPDDGDGQGRKANIGKYVAGLES
jgi:hypothetical protein